MTSYYHTVHLISQFPPSPNLHSKSKNQNSKVNEFRNVFFSKYLICKCWCFGCCWLLSLLKIWPVWVHILIWENKTHFHPPQRKSVIRWNMWWLALTLRYTKTQKSQIVDVRSNKNSEISRSAANGCGHGWTTRSMILCGRLQLKAHIYDTIDDDDHIIP